MLEKFHFTRSTGEKVDVPFLIDCMSLGKMQKLQDKNKDAPEKLTRDALTQGISKAFADDVLDEWSMRDSEAFIKGWMHREGVELGES